MKWQCWRKDFRELPRGVVVVREALFGLGLFAVLFVSRRNEVLSSHIR